MRWASVGPVIQLGAGTLRAARFTAFVVAATVLTLAAHLGAGGSPPGLAGTAAVAAVSGLSAAALSRRPRGTLGNISVLAAAQLVQHELLGALGGPVVPSAMSMPPGTAGMPHGMPMDAATMPMDDATWPGLAMTAGHAVAVLLTGALLAHGERLLDRLAARWRSMPRLLATLLRTAVPRAVLIPGPPTLPAADDVPAVVSRWACAPVVRRGPPLHVC